MGPLPIHSSISSIVPLGRASSNQTTPGRSRSVLQDGQWGRSSRGIVGGLDGSRNETLLESGLDLAAGDSRALMEASSIASDGCRGSEKLSISW